MNKLQLEKLKTVAFVRRFFNFIKDLYSPVEYYNNLLGLSYGRWQARSFETKLNLAYQLAIITTVVQLFFHFAKIFLSGESSGIIIVPLIRLASLIVGFGLLKTSWGKRHLWILFLGLSLSWSLNERILNSYGEQPLDGRVLISDAQVLDWALTFFTQAILIPLHWELHLLSQVIILGHYFGANFQPLLMQRSNGLFDLMKVVWICVICDFSVFLYVRLQRRVFRSRQKLEEAYHELEQAEIKYRSIFENSVEGLFQSNPEGKLIDVNRTLAHIFGYVSPEEMMDTINDISQQIYVDSNRRTEFMDLISHQDFVLAFESQVYQSDGTTIWILENARAVRNSNGQIVSYEGGVQDITKRKNAEAEIHRALQREKELNQLKSRFVSTISHEFRTPLTTIMAASEALEHYGHKWSEEKKQRYYHRVQKTVHHMDELLGDVLLISQTDAEKLLFKPAPTDLEQFCQNLVEEISLGLGKHHCLVFQVDPTAVPPETLPQMDERLLRQILGNLLSNAIKYSPEGERVDFQLSYDQNQAIFTIRDRGIGIPTADIERLYESFHRAQNVGTIPGTGLGLTIVQRSVTLHGGTITVQSEVGKGTIFTVELPLNLQHIGPPS